LQVIIKFVVEPFY